MIELPTLIADANLLLALQPEELAAKVLLILRNRNEEQYHLGNLLSELSGDNTRGQPGYPVDQIDNAQLAITEAWSWLLAQGLVITNEAKSRTPGWYRLSRRARLIENAQDFASFRAARLLPKEILHRKMADRVWGAFVRGEFDGAVFQAMKAVEVSVREAANLPQREIGVSLMRKAFHTDTGPLTDKNSEIAEREARQSLFVGAIGGYKNPHSHRDENLDDPSEAIEIILLASHLRKRKPTATVAGFGFQAAWAWMASLQFQGRSSLSLEARCPRASRSMA